MDESRISDIEQMDEDYVKIDKIYGECLSYLKEVGDSDDLDVIAEEPDYETIEEPIAIKQEAVNKTTALKYENELKSTESLNSVVSDAKTDRLRKLSQQLPKIIITQSGTSLDTKVHNGNLKVPKHVPDTPRVEKKHINGNYVNRNPPASRNRTAYGEYPKRLVSKNGMENVALITNVPFERIRMLNDTFHTLINLRWRWIVIGTVVVHFAIWLVFAVFWYIAALAHYDFEPDPPKKTCVTGGKDFVTIFLASVEAQTTIGFGDRTIDEECPESIFLFIMQLILGTGLSGVLTCVVYAKLTRPEKLSRDGVGFSKRAVISMRDGHLCLMIRAWDLNYDHIISSEFTAHFISTKRTKENEVIRYYAQTLSLQQRQFLLWPVTLVHVIDATSPLYHYGPEQITSTRYSARYEITISLKGASASMGTFTQSQTSYLPREVLWGYRFPPVIRYDNRKQQYVIDHKKLDATESVDTPYCSAYEMLTNKTGSNDIAPMCPGTPGSFSDQISSFQLGRSSSFRQKTNK